MKAGTRRSLRIASTTDDSTTTASKPRTKVLEDPATISTKGGLCSLDDATPSKKSKPKLPPMNSIQVDLQRLDKYVGSFISPPDGSAKAATLRFLCGSRYVPPSLYVTVPYQVQVAQSPDALLSPRSRTTIREEDEGLMTVDAIRPPDEKYVPLTFNKMSGMQQMGNVIALFVNIDGNTYKNYFAQAPSASHRNSPAHQTKSVDVDGADNGTDDVAETKQDQPPMFMTFDAQPRLDWDSPIIRRMMHAPRSKYCVMPPRKAASLESKHNTQQSSPSSQLGKPRPRGDSDGDERVMSQASLKKPRTNGTTSSSDDHDADTDTFQVTSQGNHDDGSSSSKQASASASTRSDTASPTPPPPETPPPEAVVLICRFPNQHYAYWGRLGLIMAKYVESKHLIRFTWEILHANQLRKSPGLAESIQNYLRLSPS